MKRMVRTLGWIGTAVLTVASVVALSDLPDQYAKWQTIIAWVPVPVREIAAGIFGWVLFVAIVIAAVFATVAVHRIACAIILRLFIAFSALRGIIGMGEWITRTEALAIIEASDFFAVRSGATDHGLTGVAAMLRQMRPRKDAIIQDRFRARMLASFAEQRPDAVGERGYRRADLLAWLDALIDREVDKEMGNIPTV